MNKWEEVGALTDRVGEILKQIEIIYKETYKFSLFINPNGNGTEKNFFVTLKIPRARQEQ